MTTQELADWSGKSLQNLQDHKKAWCERQLSKYAKFKIVRGGVEILEIFFSVYETSGKKEVKKKFKKYWGNGKENIDSLGNCWSKLKTNMTNDISDITGIAYVGLAKREAYGVPHKREGKLGKSQWVFCKIINGEAYSFTEEEQAIKAELEDRYLCGQKTLIYKLKSLKQSLIEKEITLEEFEVLSNDIMDREYGWEQFINALMERLGCVVGFRQELEDRAWVEEGEFTF